MCYSKEVQLLTALVIFISVAFFYVFYSAKYAQTKKKWLKPFLNNVALAFAFMGGHQFFQFLALATGNEIMHEFALLSSLMGLYFGIRSFEVMMNKNLRSTWMLWFIGAVAVYDFLVPMRFESHSFYVRSYSLIVWSAVWALFSIYAHICAFAEWKTLKDDLSRKTILLFLLVIIDLSLVLAVTYYLFGIWLFGVNACYDFASIWCTFFVVQVFFIPFFLSILPKIFKRPSRHTILSLQKTIVYLILALIAVVLINLAVPDAWCVVEQLVIN